MKEIQYVINDELGLHARPAGQLVKVASGCACEVRLSANGQTVDAKRIMGVMRLAAKRGQTLTVSCEGQGEDEAAAAIEAFLRQNL